MPISYAQLNEGGYTRQRGQNWICPKCGNKNINQPINPRSGKVQMCSLCGTPKPMVFGVRVCESCMLSDQVYVLPSYIHKCPNCGSTELRRFLPITDEALREGIHPKYASLKWKCKCGKDNPYPYANCLNCGLSIDEGLNETTDEPKEKSIQIAKKMRLSNWICPYCGLTNRGIDEKCSNCGNSYKNPEDDVIRKIRPDLFSDNISTASQERSRSNDQYANQDSITEVPGRKKLEFHLGILQKGKSFLADVTSIAKKIWWAFPILFMILLIIGNYKEEEFIVSDMKCDFTYVIEKYTTTHHTGESTYPPVNAYNIVKSQQSRYVPEQDDDDNDNWNSYENNDDNNDWGSNWGSDWDTGDDWGSDWNTGDDWGSDWNDYGGDYFDSIIHIIQKLRKSLQTYAKNVLAKIEYYTVYDYDIDEWVYSRTITYSRVKDEIKSHKSEFELADNEKVGSSSATYTIYMRKKGSDKLYHIKTSEEEWQKYQVGDIIRVKTLFGYPQSIVK